MVAFLIVCIVFLAFMTVFSVLGFFLDDHNESFYAFNILTNIVVLVGLAVALGSSC